MSERTITIEAGPVHLGVQTYRATDSETVEYTPDCGPRGVGYGHSPAEALRDLADQLEAGLLDSDGRYVGGGDE